MRASLGAKVPELKAVPASVAPTTVHICMHWHGGHKDSPRTPRHTQGCTNPCYRLTLSSLPANLPAAAIPSERW